MTDRILIEPGSYPLHNHGDNAMMQVAVERLRALWPHARISVVTSRPDTLQRLCPDVVPLLADERSAWLSARSLSGRLGPRLPAPFSRSVTALERWLWFQSPPCSRVANTLKSRMLGANGRAPGRFYKHLLDTGLIVVSGMGRINDAFCDSACDLLDELDFALSRRIPVVAFGQGIGPVTHPGLAMRARRVLPRLELIAIRERNFSLPLLQSLGVDPQRITVSGDDAIEFSWRRRRASLGTAIGVNVRLASYSTSGESFLPRLRHALVRVSARLGTSLGTSLVPLPISFSAESSDVRAYGELLDDQDLSLAQRAQDCDVLLDAVAGCRVVLTGSYHAGVFALSQGIPVIAVVQSSYYEQKFEGLRDQFRTGCEIIDFRRPVSADEIEQTIRRAWDAAASVREPLLQAAVQQIQASRAAYSMAHRLCESPSRARA